VRELEQQHPNLRSPRRGEPTAAPLNPSSGRTVKYAPANGLGWSGNVPTDVNGNMMPACVHTGITERLPAAFTGENRPLPAHPIYGDPTPQLEAKHRPGGSS